ncbi:unnamed protein product, partial [Mesorhabditis belari]|uniref:C-type lectin domain-containing protein n=1 Tax=Mesorhabditis belari TaxID=2138241 RepID=A0AAF3EXL9_9BILA
MRLCSLILLFILPTNHQIDAQFASRDFLYQQNPQIRSDYYLAETQDPVDARFRVLESQVQALTKRVTTLEVQLRDLQLAVHDDWTKTDSGSKYKIFDTQKNWDEAMSTCKSYNAHLAMINNEDKNNFLRELMRNTTNNVDFAWIGMRTRAEMASQPAIYSNFESNTQVSGCAVIDRSGIWAIRSCTQLRPFVCQQVNVV